MFSSSWLRWRQVLFLFLLCFLSVSLIGYVFLVVVVVVLGCASVTFEEGRERECE